MLSGFCAEPADVSSWVKAPMPGASKRALMSPRGMTGPSGTQGSGERIGQRQPSAPGAMRQAVEAQLRRLATSAWE